MVRLHILVAVLALALATPWVMAADDLGSFTESNALRGLGEYTKKDVEAFDDDVEVNISTKSNKGLDEEPSTSEDISREETDELAASVPNEISPGIERPVTYGGRGADRDEVHFRSVQLKPKSSYDPSKDVDDIRKEQMYIEARDSAAQAYENTGFGKSDNHEGDTVDGAVDGEPQLPTPRRVISSEDSSYNNPDADARMVRMLEHAETYAGRESDRPEDGIVRFNSLHPKPMSSYEPDGDIDNIKKAKMRDEAERFADEAYGDTGFDFSSINPIVEESPPLKSSETSTFDDSTRDRLLLKRLSSEESHE